MRALLAAIIAVSVGGHAAASSPAPVNPTARVRPMQPKVEKLLATGMDRSAAFRRLVREIEASDVIVYIEARRDLRAGLGASMRYVATSASDRFVRIQLDARHNPLVLVALLGHELQHVVEVAQNRSIRSADDLRAFYRKTGLRTGPDAFDSEAARQIGYLVREELLGRPASDVRMASAGHGREPALETASIVGGDTDGRN
jgi:hypothetical protein